MADRDERIMLNVSEWHITTGGNDIFFENGSKDLILQDDCSVNYLEVRDGLWRNSTLLGLFNIRILMQLIGVENIVVVLYVWKTVQ